MLSTILFVLTTAQPTQPAQIPVRKPYTVEPFRGASGPTRAGAPAKPIAPVVVEMPKSARYMVEPPNPVQLPKGYPKDLQQQFHPNYRRNDQ